MKIKILCLGRLNKDEENELCKRYESRLKSLKNSGITNFAIEHISKKELENIIKNKKEKKIIFLSENGQDFNTENFCKKLKKLISSSIKEILFIIGEPEYTLSLHDALPRSEERRVGKECIIYFVCVIIIYFVCFIFICYNLFYFFGI